MHGRNTRPSCDNHYRPLSVIESHTTAGLRTKTLCFSVPNSSVRIFLSGRRWDFITCSCWKDRRVTKIWERLRERLQCAFSHSSFRKDGETRRPKIMSPAMTGSFKPRQSLNHYKPAWSSQIVLNTVVWGLAWPFEPNLPTSTLPTELNGRRQRILIIINLQLKCYWEQPHVMTLKSVTHTSAPLYVQPCLGWSSSGWCHWSELLKSHINLSFIGGPTLMDTHSLSMTHRCSHDASMERFKNMWTLK